MTTETAAPTHPFRPTPPPTSAGRRRWTRRDFEFLVNAGLLEGHYELLDGEIISKVGQGSPHNICITFLVNYLSVVFGALYVRSQTTAEVRSGDRFFNKPEPDVYVVRRAAKKTPDGDNIRSAVEVCFSTYADDFDTKRTLYARAGVGEYWVLDVPNRTLTVFRGNNGEDWDERILLQENQTVAPHDAPHGIIPVSELLAPVDLPEE